MFVICVSNAQIQRTDGNWYWAEYSTFSISDEANKYQLTLAGYSGDAGDAMMSPYFMKYAANGQKFTTRDDDNDTWNEGNCADDYGGGWWMGKCTESNVNNKVNGMWETDAMHRFRVQQSFMMLKLS